MSCVGCGNIAELHGWENGNPAPYCEQCRKFMREHGVGYPVFSKDIEDFKVIHK